MKKNKILELSEEARKALSGSTNLPEIGEIAAHFIHFAGGTQQFASMLFQEYFQAKQGTMTRQRILDMVLHALKFASQQKGPIADTSLLSIEDLIREAQQSLAKISNHDSAVPTEPPT